MRLRLRLCGLVVLLCALCQGQEYPAQLPGISQVLHPDKQDFFGPLGDHLHSFSHHLSERLDKVVGPASIGGLIDVHARSVDGGVSLLHQVPFVATSPFRRSRARSNGMCIVTTVAANHHRQRKVSLLNKLAYARLHGYQVFAFDENSPFPFTERWSRQQSSAHVFRQSDGRNWNYMKIAAVVEVMLASMDSVSRGERGCEWIFWTDADAMFNRFDLALSDFVWWDQWHSVTATRPEHAPLPPPADATDMWITVSADVAVSTGGPVNMDSRVAGPPAQLLMTWDARPARLRNEKAETDQAFSFRQLNSGHWFVRVGQWGLSFLKEVFSIGHHDRRIYSWWHDQGAFAEQIRRLGEHAPAHLRFFPWAAFNSGSRDFRPDQFCLHVHGACRGDHQRCVAYLRQRFRELSDHGPHFRPPNGGGLVNATRAVLRRLDMPVKPAVGGISAGKSNDRASLRVLMDLIAHEQGWSELVVDAVAESSGTEGAVVQDTEPGEPFWHSRTGRSSWNDAMYGTEGGDNPVTERFRKDATRPVPTLGELWSLIRRSLGKKKKKPQAKEEL